MGGLDGEAIFIDTERTFFTKRLIEIATAAVEHCHSVYSDETEELKSNLRENLYLRDFKP